MKRICVIDLRYSGLVTMACCTDMGNRVVVLAANGININNCRKWIKQIGSGRE